MKHTASHTTERGFAAIVSLLAIMGMAVVFASGFLFVTLRGIEGMQAETNSAQGYYASEAGVEDAIYRLKNGKNIGLQTSFAVGSASATTTVSTIGQTKTIVGEGGRGNSVRKVQVTLTLSSQQSDFYYGVQIGAGGLVLKQNSVINGSVYSDGNITCTSSCTGTKILGDAWVAGAPAPAPDQQSTTQNADQSGGKSFTNDVAQSFQTSVSGTLAQVSAYLKKVGNPPNISVHIVSDKSGVPGGVAQEVATGTINASSIGTTYAWIDVALSSTPALSSTKTYWIVLDGGNDASNYWIWGYDTTNPYANGQAKYSADWSAGSPTWTNVNASANSDMAFKVYLAGMPTKIDGLLVTGDAHANTINNSQVCGNAYYTTIDSSSLAFLNAPGSPCPIPYTPGTAHTPSADPPSIPMAISQANIDTWEAQALAGGTIAGPYAPPNGTTIGPVKIVGDLNLTTSGSYYYINGPVWVTGNITIANNVKVILSPAFGSLSTVVLADNVAQQSMYGKIVVNNGVKICGSAGYNAGTNTCNPSNGSYVMFLSTYSGIGIAISLQNNSDGAIFYASQGSLNVDQTASAKQITGYKVELENNASITYESGLLGINFSSGPSAGWAISGWKEIQ